ncbi:DUF3152 domain-containing protein [Micromonospora sp. WMMD1120]|uniref:DUF3152 domain-containing protein n=1 Tax=Micromonospora sp. WMMD1120 TaxID=3016106 RepID=UPI002416278C|nr:DUF3152 domain-containing protein [Micromonospora sp. WMMD1120]MDG4809738.1 DUF3152 domain-containing protein [Micromonospora sp. WMMD1120]
MWTKVTGRRRTAPAVSLLMVALLTGCTGPAAGQPVSAGGWSDGSTVPAASAPSTRPAPRTTSAAPAVPVSYPATGGNRWSVARAETAPGSGTAGRLLRYRVAVERDIHGLPVADVAGAISATLNDPRGWTAGGAWRLRRVGADDPTDFTIYLATPGTRDTLCQDQPEGYTSCRNGARVVLNVARWVKGVPGYGASLATYRQYMVNHEVGHKLGFGHERCPGKGRPAPVMQQQTLGLHGCVANPWPYPKGRARYSGPVGAYDDAIPRREGAYSAG